MDKDLARVVREDGRIEKIKPEVTRRARTEKDRQRDNAYYQANKAKVHARIAARTQAIIKAARQHVMEYLTTHPCVDCGEADPIVLEFDHVRGDKKHNIGKLLTHAHASKTLIDEIAKCEVRCANCHRRKTVRELGLWRNG